MPDLDAIKTEIRRLLADGVVEVVVAFKPGDTPLHPQPAFFTNVDEVENLVYDGLCQNNLATFLNRLPKTKKIGMLVRGCENRSVNALIVEKQKSRENMVLVGVPCEGIIDWRKIVEHVGEAVLAVHENSDEVTVETREGQFNLSRNELLHASCLRCAHRNPISADILIGDVLPEGELNLASTEVEEFEAQTNEERYAWFQKEAERCIRCYACREACPMCYCTECFVDHIEPRWTESGATPAGMQGWHIVRAFHQTGRCTDCGACERACPMDIKMTYLTEKLNNDMRKKYAFEVGLDIQTQPPFATVTLDDKNRFSV
jgi:ferredoxin